MKKTILLLAACAFLTFKNQAQSTITEINSKTYNTQNNDNLTELQQTPLGCTSFTDYRDGNIYQTVAIGNQCWMSENLKYMPVASDPGYYSIYNPFYYVYGYWGTNVYSAKQTSNYNTYGVLYNWQAASNACPSGWHLPSDYEWKILEVELGMSASSANSIGYRGTNQGLQLKATYSWQSGGNGTNTSGFNALAGGWFNYNGGFTDFGYSTDFWTSSYYDSEAKYARSLFSSSWQVYRNANYYGCAAYIRCVSDDDVTTQINDNNIDKNINIYPNPAIDNVTVSSDEQNVKCEVYNSVGECVLNMVLSDFTNSVDISTLAKGVYVIKLTGENWSLNKKLVKN